MDGFQVPSLGEARKADVERAHWDLGGSQALAEADFDCLELYFQVDCY